MHYGILFYYCDQCKHMQCIVRDYFCSMIDFAAVISAVSHVHETISVSLRQSTLPSALQRVQLVCTGLFYLLLFVLNLSVLDLGVWLANLTCAVVKACVITVC